MMLLSWLQTGSVLRRSIPTRKTLEVSESAPTLVDLRGLRSLFGTSAESRGDLRIEGYSSLFDLRERWVELDHAGDGGQLTVVLILHEQFCADIAALIQRRHPALHLTIVPLGRSLPGPYSAGDLVLGSSQLGWHSLAVKRDLNDALEDARAAVQDDASVIVFWPQWHAGLEAEIAAMNPAISA